MSERFKYARNGICRIKNFTEHLAAGVFLKTRLGRLCGMKWYLTLTIEEDGKYICPAICSNNENSEEEHSIQVYYNMLNNSNGFFGFWKNREKFEETDRTVLSFDEEFSGMLKPISEILDPKNGWLDDDGALTFEYGIQVEAIMKDKTWHFNLNDKLFNAGDEMFEFEKKRQNTRSLGYLYSHCQLLKFHSEKFAMLENTLTIKRNNIKFVNYERTWQIVHGVQLQLTVSEIFGVIFVASKQKMSNVIRYCDGLLLQKRDESFYLEDRKQWIPLAIKYNLRRWMVQLLKPMKSMKDCIHRKDIQNMSNESMKRLIAKFLYEKI